MGKRRGAAGAEANATMVLGPGGGLVLPAEAAQRDEAADHDHEVDEEEEENGGAKL